MSGADPAPRRWGRGPTTSAKMVSSAQTMRSDAQASIIPAAMHGPCTEATVVLRRSRQRCW